MDGRKNGKGMTIDELADYKFADNSINLDGGGSTRLHINGKTINNPTENRRISSVIAIKLKKNTGGIKSINEVDKIKIVIDYGHNDSSWDTGASYFGLREQDLTF